MCVTAGRHPAVTAWPLCLWGPAYPPAGPSFFSIIFTEDCGLLGLDLHAVTGQPAYLWAPNCSPNTKVTLPGAGCFSPGASVGLIPDRTRQPQWELQALLVTAGCGLGPSAQSHSPKGGSWLGCSAVNGSVLLYFGTSVELANLFWFKLIILSIKLELHFLGSYAESSARARCCSKRFCSVRCPTVLCCIWFLRVVEAALSYSPPGTNLRCGVLALYMKGQQHAIPKRLYI